MRLGDERAHLAYLIGAGARWDERVAPGGREGWLGVCSGCNLSPSATCCAPAKVGPGARNLGAECGWRISH